MPEPDIWDPFSLTEKSQFNSPVPSPAHQIPFVTDNWITPCRFWFNYSKAGEVQKFAFLISYIFWMFCGNSLWTGRGLLEYTFRILSSSEVLTSLVAQRSRIHLQCRRHSLIPGSGRSPGEGNGNPLQCSYLGNAMDRGSWWATVHGVAKELDMTEQLSTHTCCAI